MPKAFKVKIAEILRDSTHNLILNEENELDNNAYFSRLKYFVGLLEGSKNGAYLDGIPNPRNPSEFMSAAHFYSLSKATQDKLREDCFTRTGKGPVTTVGIGANLELDGILDRFDEVLGVPGLMEKVYYGEATLTNEQVDMIFRDCIDTRQVELRKIYGSDWQKLRANERMAIQSLYFNHRKLVGGHTNFRKHIKNYVETNNETYLKLAAHEVTKKSNPDKLAGIQNRRDAEGVLLASYDSPTYTKPNQSPDAKKLTAANLNDTVIPLNNDSAQHGTNSDYFIWRTKLDNDVREKHAEREGKVFKKSNPPDGYMPGTGMNCRCESEKVPDYIIINDSAAKAKALDLYLRKGIVHPILFLK